MRVTTALVIRVTTMDRGKSNRGCHAGWRCFRSTLGVILGRWRVLRWWRSGLIILGTAALRILLSIAVVGHSRLVAKPHFE
jgi:hypothetical protein